MLRPNFLGQNSSSIIPLIYAVTALGAGMTIPRLENVFFPGLISPMSVASASAIYSCIASGMIALTGIVFSLTFVMLQFSATVYSPRVVLWIARDPVMAHALGVFVATFLYSIGALAGVDRNHTGTVPITSVCVVVALLLASVAMFVSLIHRVGQLQINPMLIFIGNQGRKVIETLYAPLQATVSQSVIVPEESLPTTQVVIHRGSPRTIQAIDVPSLLKLANRAGAVIDVVSAVGDTVVDATPLLLVKNSANQVSEVALREAVILGAGRTFEQDPKYAIRLLVDIAIRALSPAVNDPTTAVQSLDQIQDQLLRLGRSQLRMGHFRDAKGKVRVIIRVPQWEDFLRLAFDEIRAYGSSSVQVMRRMKSVIRELIEALPAERHDALIHWESRLSQTVIRSFDDLEERLEASTEDRQGLGIPRQHRSSSEEIATHH